jgi:hypothetical protein
MIILEGQPNIFKVLRVYYVMERCIAVNHEGKEIILQKNDKFEQYYKDDGKDEFINSSEKTLYPILKRKEIEKQEKEGTVKRLDDMSVFESFYFKTYLKDSISYGEHLKKRIKKQEDALMQDKDSFIRYSHNLEKMQELEMEHKNVR